MLHPCKATASSCLVTSAQLSATEILLGMEPETFATTETQKSLIFLYNLYSLLEYRVLVSLHYFSVIMFLNSTALFYLSGRQPGRGSALLQSPWPGMERLWALLALV